MPSQKTMIKKITMRITAKNKEAKSKYHNPINQYQAISLKVK